jgi:hypothetical protein
MKLTTSGQLHNKRRTPPRACRTTLQQDLQPARQHFNWLCSPSAMAIRAGTPQGDMDFPIDNAPQHGPRCPQDGQVDPNMAQDTSKLAQDGPRCPQDGLNMAPKLPKLIPAWMPSAANMLKGRWNKVSLLNLLVIWLFAINHYTGHGASLRIVIFVPIS